MIKEPTVTTDYSIEHLAAQTDGTATGHTKKRIRGVATFETANADEITFAADRKRLKQIDGCRAGAIIVPIGFEAPGKNLIRAGNPKLAFAQIVSIFHPTPAPPPGIDERSLIGDNVNIGKGVYVGAFATIGDGVTIGSNTVINNGVFIGNDVVLGNHSIVHPNVTIMNGCRIGSRVIIHPGTVIGSDGYGFVPDGGRHFKLPQTGIVCIDDDVEIGACNTIDRATFGQTWIQRGVKTDNLVHIAHNVVIGEDSIIVAQAGIAGSTTIGHHATIAGQAAISDHLTIGNHVIVGPKTGVGKSIADGEVVSASNPSMPHRKWLRVQRIIPDLPELKKKISMLEKTVAELRKTINAG